MYRVSLTCEYVTNSTVQNTTKARDYNCNLIVLCHPDIDPGLTQTISKDSFGITFIRPVLNPEKLLILKNDQKTVYYNY